MEPWRLLGLHYFTLFFFYESSSSEDDWGHGFERLLLCWQINVNVHFQGVQVAMVGSVEHGRVASVFEIMVLPGRA